MSNLRNKPIDQRYLSDQDKDAYQRGGGAAKQQRALQRAKAYQGQMAYNAKRQERTTTQTPGTGGFKGGLAMQQERYREIGRECSNRCVLLLGTILSHLQADTQCQHRSNS